MLHWIILTSVGGVQHTVKSMEFIKEDSHCESMAAKLTHYIVINFELYAQEVPYVIRT